MKTWMAASVALIAMAGAAFAHASSAEGEKGMKMMDGQMSMAGKGEKAASGATHHGTGVVQKVDAGSGKVTLKHEPIRSIGWPAMTMAFDVKDKSLLRDVKPGQKVDFAFSEQGSRYVISTIK